MKIRFGLALLLCISAVRPAFAEERKKVELVHHTETVRKGHRQVFDVVLPAGVKVIDMAYDCYTQSMSNYSKNVVSVVLVNAAGETVRSFSDRFDSETSWGYVSGVIHTKKFFFDKSPKPGKYKLRISVRGGDYMNFVGSFMVDAILAE